MAYNHGALITTDFLWDFFAHKEFDTPEIWLEETD